MSPIPKIVGGQSPEQQLTSVRYLKNSLVGDETAKRSALALFVVQDVLVFLDAAGDGGGGGGGGGHFYESSLLHGIGLLSILCSSPLPEGLAKIYLAPSGSRIVKHITRAMEIAPPPRTSGGGGGNGSSEKLTATALRAISSLCMCLIPATTAVCSAGDDAVAAAAAAKEEKLKTLTALKEVARIILDEIVATPTTTAPATGGGGRGRQRWSWSVRTLGIEALAAMTRVEVQLYYTIQSAQQCV